MGCSLHHPVLHGHRSNCFFPRLATKLRDKTDIVYASLRPNAIAAARIQTTVITATTVSGHVHVRILDPETSLSIVASHLSRLESGESLSSRAARGRGKPNCLHQSTACIPCAQSGLSRRKRRMQQSPDTTARGTDLYSDYIILLSLQVPHGPCARLTA